MNYTEHLKINDEGEEMILTLCDNPYECFTCKEFINRIRQSLLKEWMNKNSIEKNIQLSTFKIAINETNYELLSIDGLNKWLGEIMPFFEQYTGELWPTSSVLLETNLSLSPNKQQIYIHLTIIYPESVGKTEHGIMTLFHHDDCMSVSHQSINSKTFYNQNAIDNIFSYNDYDDLFENHWDKFSFLSGVNKTTSIYLYSWGLFQLKLQMHQGYYCNDWALNNNQFEKLTVKANNE